VFQEVELKSSTVELIDIEIETLQEFADFIMDQVVNQYGDHCVLSNQDATLIRLVHPVKACHIYLCVSLDLCSQTYISRS
jgi:hypothetical protein